MKYINLIRHASSDLSGTGQNDFDRTLNVTGKRVAPKMGRKLNELKFHPNKVYCSTAKRAVQTSDLLVEQLDYSLGKVNHTDELYEASIRTLLEFINTLDDEYHDVAIIGHNPSISYLTEYLTGETIDNMPTTGVVRMSFKFDEWKMISQNTGELIYYIYPQKFDF